MKGNYLAVGTLGICKETKNAGETCPDQTNYQCKNGACGRRWYGSTLYICCESGKNTDFLLKDYCVNPDGKACKTDAMCEGGWCKVSHGFSFRPSFAWLVPSI